MRTIITGGTGLIGRALAASLAADGNEVVVLSRNPDRASDLPAGVQAQGWDAHSAQGWGHLADGADAIVNLAGQSIAGLRWTQSHKRRIRQSRLNAAQAVVEAIEAAANKPRVLIQASGVGYYGDRGDQRVTEQTPPGDDWLARFAVEWEASSQPVETWGVRRAMIRTGAVLSTRGGVLPLMALPFKLFVGGPVGSGRQYVPWIHIVDEVAAIRFLIDNQEAAGPFNLSAPNPLTNAQFSRTLARVLGRPAWIRVPGPILRLLLGEMASLVLEGQRAVPQRLLDIGFSFRFPDAEAALRDLL